MFGLFSRLFGPKPEVFSDVRSTESGSNYEIIDGRMFQYTRRKPLMLFGRSAMESRDYFCPDCGEKLSEGPCGGMAVNAVCRKCKINWGNLPAYWGNE